MDSTGFSILIIVLISALGYPSRFLTISGSVAAAAVGSLTFLGLGLKGLILLGVFFATSSFWSIYKRVYKTKVEERLAKGSQRDWQQVLANGGAAAVASFLYIFYPSSLWIFAFCLLIASSNSDTWASEIGTLSRKRPLSIRTLSVVEKGTSGAISFLGTGAALAGSFLIAVSSFYLFQLDLYVVLLIFVFGFLGNVIDTFLGAFFQAGYKCLKCNIETEKQAHCGQKTKLVKGVSFLNNDTVNFLSGLIAVLIGIIFVLIIL